jgi:hypothetical protein
MTAARPYSRDPSRDRGQLIPSNDLAVTVTARYLEFGVLVGPGDEPHFRRVPRLL